MFEIYKNVYSDVKEGIYEKVDAYEPIPTTDHIELPRYALKVLEEEMERFAENHFDFDWVNVVPTKDCYYGEIFVHKYTLEEIKSIMGDLKYNVYGYTREDGNMYYCVVYKFV